MVFCLSMYKTTNASPTLLFKCVQVPTTLLLNHFFFQFDVENVHRQFVYVCVRIYSCSSVYQCEWLSSFVKVWLWLCESPVERETEILITRRGVLWTWFIGNIINGVRFSCHAWYFSTVYTWGTLLMNSQLERAPLRLLPDWSSFYSISVSFIQYKMNDQYGERWACDFNSDRVWWTAGVCVCVCMCVSGPWLHL